MDQLMSLLKPKQQVNDTPICKYIIKNDAFEFDLQTTFNQLSMFVLNPPEIPNLNNK